MNLTRFAQSLNALQAAIRALDRHATGVDRIEGELSAVLSELSAIRETTDPFARHVFQARRDWKTAVANRNGKSTRGVDAVDSATFHKAVDLGYKGSFYGWQKILESGQ